jgi:penicillin-insensitive murein endopeptidase
MWNYTIIAPLLLLSASALGNTWSETSGPTRGPARAIGDTSAGCISGARTLATEGEGYVVMHLERDRYHGHPALLGVIRTLGNRVAQGLGMMHIGDLGMARGGPMPFGHRSHQTGLDADVWFDLDPGLHRNADDNRSTITAPSFLTPVTRQLDTRLWSDRQAQMLKAAAIQPAVDRIFVNARIKQVLCDTVRGERSWLRKIRPWYHHDDHFHMRLACPPDSPSCVRQEPIPAGEGCDASLSWWFDRNPALPSPAKPVPPPKPLMPAECRRVLAED